MQVSDIIAELEAQIVSGEIPPDSRLPSERGLSKRFNCSRQTVREALAELRSRGIIQTRHGHGSTVRGLVTPHDELDAMEGFYETYPRILYDVLDMREVLESKAAALAAQRATLRDRYRIKQAYQAMCRANTADKPGEAHARADFEFHKIIAEASQSPVLAHTLNGLSRLFARSVRASVDHLYGHETEREMINDHHERIFAAIMSRDARAAERAARRHIKNVSASLKRLEKDQSAIVRN